MATDWSGHMSAGIGRAVGRLYKGGVALNVNFKRVLYALISALTLYIVNVLNLPPPKKGGGSSLIVPDRRSPDKHYI